MFPLIRFPKSSPELVVRHSVCKTEHPIKYNMGEAVIWGPNTEHATACVAYEGGYHLCVPANIGFINALNDEINLPSVPDMALLGIEWLSKNNELVHLKEGSHGLMEGNHPPAKGSGWLINVIALLLSMAYERHHLRALLAL